MTHFGDEVTAVNPDIPADGWASADLVKKHGGSGRPAHATWVAPKNGTAGLHRHTEQVHGVPMSAHEDLSAWQPPVADASVNHYARDARSFVLSASPHSDTNLRDAGQYVGSHTDHTDGCCA